MAESLEYLYEDSEEREKPSWVAPIDWAPIKGFDVNVARYKVEPNSFRHSEYQHVEIPISNDHYISLRFYTYWSANFSDDQSLTESREWLDRSHIHKLIDDIIDSLKVTLSDEAKQQQKEALQGLSDTSLVKDFPPIDFAKHKKAVSI